MYLYLSNINSKKRLPIISNENSVEINTEKLHVLNEMMNHSVIPLRNSTFFFLSCVEHTYSRRGTGAVIFIIRLHILQGLSNCHTA